MAEFIKRGAKLDAVFNLVGTPLEIAALHQRKDAMRLLIAEKASLEETDEAGVTAVGFAAMFGRHEEVQILLEAGASVTVKDRWGHTPLMKTVNRMKYEQIPTNERIAVVQALITAGTPVNDRDPNNRTALDIAQLTGNDPDFIQTLRDLGARTAEELSVTSIPAPTPSRPTPACSQQ